VPIIDIHAHYVSPDLIAEAERNGTAYGVRVEHNDKNQPILVIGDTVPLRPIFPELSSLTLRLPFLKSFSIDRQVISTWTDLAGDELHRKEAARWSRLQNDTLAAAARSMPERFEAMGTLPMQFPDLAVAEIDYLVRSLNIRSVEIGTNIVGRDLDHDDYRPVWRRLAGLDVFALLHPPRNPVGLERAGNYFLNNLLCYPADTTMAAARLIFSGLLQELPTIKICLAHGGGFLPYQIGRLDRGFAAHPACKKVLSRPPSVFLRYFYFDSLTHHTGALDYLVGLIGSDKVIYGSDYPFEMLDDAGPDRIRQLRNLPTGGKESILSGNVLRLLAPPNPSRPGCC
jgi:aminocarboxymuconate-semialdehyde decarboxylase